MSWSKYTVYGWSSNISDDAVSVMTVSGWDYIVSALFLYITVSRSADFYLGYISYIGK